ncbi:DUF6215 domain-containing protein [Streptomyces collinus]|uniref:DUF6215 domain-containing protein n=1 Tax=Streptomyces collinus TaxID=42684 RepID=UPI0036968BAB
MLGLLLRFLPFWVREPLFIVIGSVFGVRIMYLAVDDHDWKAAGIGTVFLVFTAIRVHTVVKALRARRNPGPAPAQAPTPTQTPALAQTPTPALAQTPAPAPAQLPAQAPAPAPAVAGPPSSPGAPEKDHNAWGQALAAFGVFGALAAAIWLGPHMLPSDDNSAHPASCSDSKDSEHDKLPKAYARTPGAVTGDELCEALNRPDLPRLLGTPRETATTAYGNNGTAALTDGKVAEPEAQVEFDTYTVNVSASYNHLSTAQYVRLFDIAGDRAEKDVRTVKVLGRPAFFSSDHTMKFEINFGEEHKSAPVRQGPLARSLSIALDHKDRGGFYDITVWSKSGALPPDTALVDIAEKVLPTVIDRSAH